MHFSYQPTRLAVLFLQTALFLFPALFLSLHLHAQGGSGTISGAITDSLANPIPFASVVLEGTATGVQSDAAGAFRLENVPAGEQNLLISFVGYRPEKRRVRVEAGKTTQLSVVLKVDVKELSEVVISAASSYKEDLPSPSLRLNQPLLEIPQNIAVIGPELIRDQQLFSLAEVERNVSGVTTNFPYPGVYTDFMIRGSRAGANQFRNGIQTANATQLMEDMSFVENVEFVKGPAGFMISQGEPGGLYNVYTKKPARQQIREVGFTYGSFNLFRGTLDLGGSFRKEGKLLYRLNAMGQRARTHIDHDYNNRYALAPVLAYEFSKRTKLTAEYNFQQAHIGIVEPSVFSQQGYRSLPTSFTYYEPAGAGARITDHTFYLNLQHAFSPNWKLTAQTGYSHGSWYGNRFDFDFGPQGIIDAEGNMYRTYELRDVATKSLSSQLFLNGNVSTGSLKHELLLGLDANEYTLADRRTDASVDPINIYRPEYKLTADALPVLSLEGVEAYQESANYTALYVQDMLRLFKGLRLTLAGRYTRANLISFEDGETDEQVGAFTPRIGISYSLNPRLALYALYDESFIPQAGTSVDGIKFNPLRGNNLEAGIKKDWLGKALSTNLSVYQITKANMLTADPLNPGYEIQRGEIQSKGVEFDMMGTTALGLQVVFNYAYTDSRITEDTDELVRGQRVDGVARHATNLWLKYQLPQSLLKGLSVGLGGRYLAGRAAYTGLLLDVATNKFPELDDWKQLDASIAYKLEKLQLALNINNLTNAKNYTGLPVMDLYYTQYSPPLNFRLSATLKF